MASNEQDLRLNILNTLLTTPHRQLQDIWPTHQDMVRQDPRFYVRLAAWYSDNGEVRDHKEMFIVNLALSNFPGHRDVGLALLRGLPPYEVVRVVDFIHGRKSNRKVRDGKAKDAPAQTVVESFGLFRNPPRALRTEVVSSRRALPSFPCCPGSGRGVRPECRASFCPRYFARAPSESSQGPK